MSPVFSSEEAVAEESMSEAESVVVSAYRAVLEAEKVGANVTILLSQLNDAVSYLSKAYMSYRMGNLEDASHSANLCVDVGKEIEMEALGLRDEAEKESSRSLVNVLILSGIGVFSVLCVSAAGWGIFKKLYFKRILKLKPEVASDES